MDHVVCTGWKGGESRRKQKSEKIGSERIVRGGIRVPENWQDREYDVGV